MNARPTQSTSFGPGAIDLHAFLERCLTRHGRLADHVDLDLGGEDEPDREHALYLLLGLAPTSPILIGVDPTDPADLRYCRAQWGEADHHVDLGDARGLALRWDIWRTDASRLLNTYDVGPSLILQAHDPRWVILVDHQGGNPLLFPAPSGCVHHQAP